MRRLYFVALIVCVVSAQEGCNRGYRPPSPGGQGWWRYFVNLFKPKKNPVQLPREPIPPPRMPPILVAREGYAVVNTPKLELDLARQLFARGYHFVETQEVVQHWGSSYAQENEYIVFMRFGSQEWQVKELLLKFQHLKLKPVNDDVSLSNAVQSALDSNHRPVVLYSNTGLGFPRLPGSAIHITCDKFQGEGNLTTHVLDLRVVLPALSRVNEVGSMDRITFLSRLNQEYSLAAANRKTMITGVLVGTGAAGGGGSVAIYKIWMTDKS